MTKKDQIDFLRESAERASRTPMTEEERTRRNLLNALLAYIDSQRHKAVTPDTLAITVNCTQLRALLAAAPVGRPTERR